MYPAWVTSGIASLIRQFCDPRGNAAWIGVASLDGLGGMSSGRLWRQSGGYEVMAGLPISEGFVWRPTAADVQPELWLSPTRASYRDTFERFAQRYLGAAGLVGANVQIDHVFPKRAADLGGMAYVRMLAVPPESNMMAGATLEHGMRDRNLALGRRGKRTRLATYFSIGKATGFTGYDGIPDDQDGAPNQALGRALLAHLRAFGLPADVLTDFDAQLTGRSAGRLR